MTSVVERGRGGRGTYFSQHFARVQRSTPRVCHIHFSYKPETFSSHTAPITPYLSHKKSSRRDEKWIKRLSKLKWRQLPRQQRSTRFFFDLTRQGIQLTSASPGRVTHNALPQERSLRKHPALPAEHRLAARALVGAIDETGKRR